MNSEPHQPIGPQARSAARKRVIAWVLFLILVGIAAVGLRHYRIENDLHRWAPGLAGHRFAETYLVIGGEKQWLDTAELARALGALPEVMFCVQPDAPVVAPLRLYRSPAKTEPAAAAFKDPGYTGLFCFARAGVDDSRFLRSVADTINDTLGGRADHVALGGPAVFAAALNDWSQRRLPLISALIILVGGALLARVAGGVRTALATTAAVVGSQIILVGLLSWLGVAMDMVMSMVWPLMMALGYSFAAHRALRPGITGTLALCAATTAAGIFSFVFTTFPPIRAFAAWGAAGLMLTWASVMLLVPCTPRPAQRRPSRHAMACHAVRAAHACAFRHPRKVVLAASLLTLAATACLPYLQLERDPIHYFPESARARRDHVELDERLIGMLPFEVAVLDPDASTNPADAGDMLSRTPGVGLIAEISFLGPAHARHYLGFADGEALGDLIAAQSGWQTWASEHHVSLRWAGVAAQLHGVAVGLVHVSATAFPAMVLLAGIIIWLVSGRSLRIALIGAWVNLLPIVALIPAICLAGLPLSLPSLMIGAIAVGAAIDDTLHLVVELRRGGGIERVWLRCLRPCAGSSLITAACMALFLFAPFRPTAEFGALMAAAITAALAGDLILLPALLTLTGSQTSCTRVGRMDLLGEDAAA